MKKVSVVVLLIVAIACVFGLTACNKDNEEITVVKYVIDESTYTVGDSFDKAAVVVNAQKSDDSTVKISKNLVVGQAGIDSLALDSDSKLTKAGTFTLKVYILEENADYPEFFIGDWLANRNYKFYYKG